MYNDDGESLLDMPKNFVKKYYTFKTNPKTVNTYKFTTNPIDTFIHYLQIAKSLTIRRDDPDYKKKLRNELRH